MAYFTGINQIFARVFQQILTDFILRGMDKIFYTGMILVALQKPFDTVLL